MTAMRVIVTGSRHLFPLDHARQIVAGIVVRAWPGDLRIVHGCCSLMESVDWAFDQAALEAGAEVECFHPEQYGRWPGCGPKRNSDMVKYGADLGIAYHDKLAESRGTLDCVRKLLAAGIPVLWYDGMGHNPCRITGIQGRKIIVGPSHLQETR
jgi:hypothetical protein